MAETLSGTHCTYPRRDGQAEQPRVAWINTGIVDLPKVVTYPSTNRGRRSVTSLMWRRQLPLVRYVKPTTNHHYFALAFALKETACNTKLWLLENCHINATSYVYITWLTVVSSWTSASEMTYIVSSGALNSTHSLIILDTHKFSTRDQDNDASSETVRFTTMCSETNVAGGTIDVSTRTWTASTREARIRRRTLTESNGVAGKEIGTRWDSPRWWFDRSIFERIC